MKPKSSSEIERISHFLDSLKNEAWLRNARRKSWWPDYLFHFTNIPNAVSILREGALLSRDEVHARGLMATDNASPEIIANTADEWKDYARLYFRPRTPTQYNNEGFRPLSDRSLNSHCPAPIYFFFDSKEVLKRSDVRFTAVNIATNPDILSTAAELEQIPFNHVYHDTPIYPGTPEAEEKRNIIHRRNAEVIVPNQLDLGALRYIVCRSQAEQETFLHFLPQTTRRRWRNKLRNLRIDTNRKPVFFKYWAYVESANLSSSHLTFHFNRPLEILGTFQADVYVTDAISGNNFRWTNPAFTASKPLPIDLVDHIGRPLSDYFVRLTLDGDLAFADRYQDDLPW